jgi:hypothetical protein
MTPSMSSGRDLRFSAGPPDRKGNHRRFPLQLASTSKRRPSRGSASRHAEDSRETSRAVVAAGAGTTGAIARSHPARRCRSSPADVLDARNVRRGFALSVSTTCASQRGASTPRLWPACGAPRPRRARTGVLPRGASARCQTPRGLSRAGGWLPLEPCPRWLSGDRMSLDRWPDVFARLVAARRPDSRCSGR